MTHNLYITAMEPGSGKSLVALGLMEMLAGRAQAAGFFRPIVAGAEHPELAMMRERYGLELLPEEMYALSAAEAQRMDDRGGGPRRARAAGVRRLQASRAAL